MSRSLLTPALAMAALLTGVLAAAWLYHPPSRELQHGVLLPDPRPLPADVTVFDERGEARPLNAFTGEWTLIFPGFTYCPDICPTTLGLLAALPSKVPGLKVRLFSIDPERDSPERLRAYVQHFHPEFGAFTTPEPGLAAAARALAVVYVRVPTADGADYTMDHSSALALLNPKGEVAAFFTPPFDIPGIAEDLKRLTARSGRS